MQSSLCHMSSWCDCYFLKQKIWDENFRVSKHFSVLLLSFRVVEECVSSCGVGASNNNSCCWSELENFSLTTVLGSSIVQSDESTLYTVLCFI